MDQLKHLDGFETETDLRFNTYFSLPLSAHITTKFQKYIFWNVLLLPWLFRLCSETERFE